MCPRCCPDSHALLTLKRQRRHCSGLVHESASVRRMNPTVEAALISGGWATIVALLGYGFSRTITRANLAATNANTSKALDAAHAAQLWDKRAESYIDVLSVISRNLIICRFFVSPPLEEAAAESLQNIYEVAKNVDWALLQARVAVFAPERVLDALNAALHAHLEFDEKFHAWKAEGGQVGNDLYSVARDSSEAAAVTAKKLETLVRADLARRPSERAD